MDIGQRHGTAGHVITKITDNQSNGIQVADKIDLCAERIIFTGRVLGNSGKIDDFDGGIGSFFRVVKLREAGYAFVSNLNNGNVGFCLIGYISSDLGLRACQGVKNGGLAGVGQT